MPKEQKRSAELSVDQKIDEVLGHLRDLENKCNENAGKIAGLEDQIDEVDRVTRSAFEGIGVDLPGRRFSIRAGVSSFEIQVSAATVEVRGGSRMARLRRWWERQVRRSRLWVWGE
jgi:hypothetical protein